MPAIPSSPAEREALLTAYAAVRQRTARVLVPSPTARRATALRCLLAAWLGDGAHLPPAFRPWLQERLAQRSWVPTMQERDRLLPYLRRWAEAQGISATVTHALEEDAPCP